MTSVPCVNWVVCEEEEEKCGLSASGTRMSPVGLSGKPIATTAVMTKTLKAKAGTGSSPCGDFPLQGA